MGYRIFYFELHTLITKIGQHPMLKRLFALLVLLIFLPSGTLSSQSEAPQEQERKKFITLSYGKRIESAYGIYGNLFTGSILSPRRKRNFMEFELRYFYSSELRPFEVEPAISDEVLEDVIRPEVRFKYNVGLFEWKFLVLYLNPYAYGYYEQIDSGPPKYQWPDPEILYPNKENSGGIGIGAEFRPYFRISQNLGLFSTISFNLWQLSYVSSTFSTVDPGDEDTKYSGMQSDIFLGDTYWTFGLAWAF